MYETWTGGRHVQTPRAARENQGRMKVLQKGFEESSGSFQPHRFLLHSGGPSLESEDRQLKGEGRSPCD